MGLLHHFRPAGNRLGRLTVVAALSTGLALSGTPAAQAAPSDWTIIAHRGGLVAAPEHTFAAYRYMLLRGVDAVEVDIQFTKDASPVAFHDATLNRTTDCLGRVKSLTKRQIKRCDAGSWFGLKFAGEQVPTLARTFNFISRRSDRITFYLHMKDASFFGAKRVMKLVKNKGVRSRVIPISGSQRGLANLKKAGFKRLGYVFNTPAGWRSNYKVLIPYNVTSNPNLVARAQARGQRVFPVENHPHSVGALAGVDIDGVLANDIDRTLILAGRLVPPPGQTFDEPGEPEPTVIPAGESRTTGPMDF